MRPFEEAVASELAGLLRAGVPTRGVHITVREMVVMRIERGPLGANLVGSADEVAAKIVYEHELFGLDRFLIQMSVGTLPREKVLRSIELFGTKVAPVVRREVERKTAAIPMPAG